MPALEVSSLFLLIYLINYVIKVRERNSVIVALRGAHHPRATATQPETFARRSQWRASICHHNIAFSRPSPPYFSIQWLGIDDTFILILIQILTFSHLRASGPYVDHKPFAISHIFAFTLSTITSSSARPFLWLGRRPLSPIPQLKWQDVA